MNIIDLHCDLLTYLVAKGKRNPFQEEALCSFPQLQRGNVFFQILAVFTETNERSVEEGRRQIAAYHSLPKEFIKEGEVASHPGKIHVRLAFENASSFASESEPLTAVLNRLALYIENDPFAYISLTWNSENRFGGGALTEIGLKRDGEILLEYLSGKNICIDLSHTSDQLASDIFNCIDKRGLKLQTIASHSNFRKVNPHLRNLSDALAKEIIRRKGVIGMNLFRAFIGENFEKKLIEMFEHALLLGGEEALCFGADFFCTTDFESSLAYPKPFFHHDFSDAGCYPKILKLLKTRCSEDVLQKFSYKNASRLLCM